MADGLEEAEGELEEGIEERRGVARVEVERGEAHVKAQLGLVVELAGFVPPQALRERPAEHVAHGDFVEMEVERHGVVEADVQVLDGAVVHEAEGECGDPALDAPEEEARAIGHLAADAGEELGREMLEAHRGAVVGLLVKRVDFTRERRDVGEHLAGDRRLAVELVEFVAQAAADALALELLEAGEIEIEHAAGHARHAAVFGREGAERLAASGGEILEEDHRGARLPGVDCEGIVECGDGPRLGEVERAVARGAACHQHPQAQPAGKKAARQR